MRIYCWLLFTLLIQATIFYAAKLHKKMTLANKSAIFMIFVFFSSFVFRTFYIRVTRMYSRHPRVERHR